MSGVKDRNKSKTDYGDFEREPDDSREPLARGLKERNKAKSDAFSEFEKRHKNW